MLIRDLAAILIVHMVSNIGEMGSQCAGTQTGKQFLVLSFLVAPCL